MNASLTKAGGTSAIVIIKLPNGASRVKSAFFS